MSFPLLASNFCKNCRSPIAAGPTESEAGSYWRSQQMRGAVGFSTGDLEMAEIEAFTRQLGSLHSRYQSYGP
jgi:hypothetical protein